MYIYISIWFHLRIWKIRILYKFQLVVQIIPEVDYLSSQIIATGWASLIDSATCLNEASHLPAACAARVEHQVVSPTIFFLWVDRVTICSPAALIVAVEPALKNKW